MTSLAVLLGLAILALAASAYTIVDLLNDGYRRRATLDGPEPDRTLPRSPEHEPELQPHLAGDRSRVPSRDKVARKTSTSRAAKAAARRSARASHHAMEGE